MIHQYLLSTLAALAVFAAAPAGSQPIQNYRASGNEPSWGLTINQQEMTFTRLNGRAISVRTPRPTRNSSGRVYPTPRLYVSIIHTRCIDSMSGKAFPDRVTVIASARRYTGCGNAVVARNNLARTNWHVMTINGAAPRGKFGAFMNFDDRGFSGSFGCRHFNGTFRHNGTALNADHNVSGRPCPATAANAIDNDGRTVLNQPMQVEWINNRRVRLSNRLGRIDLNRSN